MANQDTYSTYDAKARFSEVMRRVREGRTVTVTYHGEPIAEIRPLGQSSGTEARMEWLRSRGVLEEAGGEVGHWAPVARRPGALDRFLAERDQ